MILIEINGTKFYVKSNLSILEACKYVGINIPRFCYHETLSVAGNCRMCLVELANSPKPIAACAFPIVNGMKVFTNTPLVKKARENIIEVLLLNHPLDCPICDQGGECDLQDQAKAFGHESTKYFYQKRPVEDKYCGPLIKTIMTRCIHCTRCVRFSTEIAGVDYFGTLNRGVYTEVGNYLNNTFISEISGNVIELCPVGALTSKVYAFKSRPWELRTTESIDLTDSTGSNIYINYKEVEILRITPKINLDINNNIITDKSRFSYDASKLQRITKVFKKTDTQFILSNWDTFLTYFETKLVAKKVVFLINDELDLESLTLLKQLAFKYNKLIKIKSVVNSTTSNFYIQFLNEKINNIKLSSKICILMAINIRFESAILNLRLRLKFLEEDFSIFSTMQYYKSNFPVQFINLNIENCLKFLEAKHIFLSKILISFKSPIILIGSNLYKNGFTFETIFKSIKTIVPTASIFNIVKACNSESLSLLRITKINTTVLKNAEIIVCFNLMDTTFLAKTINHSQSTILWLNTHGSKLASKANFILPLLHDFEEENIFINLENRPQKTTRVFRGLHETKSLKYFLMYLLQLESKNTQDYVPAIIKELVKIPTIFNKLSTKLSKNLLPLNKIIINLTPNKTVFEDFYLSTKTTKNSINMLNISKNLRKLTTNFF